MSDATTTFFEQRREWSRRKHEVFSGYLPQFTRILSKVYRTIYLVDGFAGAGYYGDGSDRVPGSPILAATIAKDLAAGGRYRLNCVNVEADRTAYLSLSSNMAPFSEWVTTYQGSFAQNADAILQQVGQNPVLFFLDPFGVGGLEWETLIKLAKRSAMAPTEFMINLNVPKIDRHAGWLDSFDQKPQQAFLRLLDRTMGTTEWRKIWDQPLTKEKRYNRIVQFYLRRISDDLRLAAAAYPIRTVDRQELKYYLVFATKHRLGLRIMSSILYGVEQRYLQECAERQASEPIQLSLGLYPAPRSIEDLEMDDLVKLQEDVLALGRQVGNITFSALQDRLVHKWIGRMVEKHYRKVCKNLITSGSVMAFSGGFKDQTPLRFIELATESSVRSTLQSRHR